MKTRLVILANHMTRQRVVSQISLLEETVGLMKDLNEKVGGDWVFVQELKPYQAIPFSASKSIGDLTTIRKMITVVT